MEAVNRFECPRCGSCSSEPHDIAAGYCGACHDWTRGWVKQDCPCCGTAVGMVPYDIGSGPEMSCPHCEWCWGANGQPLQPLEPYRPEAK